jgi:hypothetical protein
MTSDKADYGHWSTAELALKAARKEAEGYRRLLWVIVRNYEGLQFYVSKKDLALIPEGATLLQWDEPLFDSVILKAICNPINQPGIEKSVDDSSEAEGRK